MSARHAYALMILLVATPALPAWSRWIVGAWLAGLWLLTWDENTRDHDDADDQVLRITTNGRWN